MFSSKGTMTRIRHFIKSNFPGVGEIHDAGAILTRIRGKYSLPTSSSFGGSDRRGEEEGTRDDGDAADTGAAAAAAAAEENYTAYTDSSVGNTGHDTGAGVIEEDDAEAAGRADYWTPHVDEVEAPHYQFSAVLYLNTAWESFTGGAFAFRDLDADRIVEPRQGRVIIFSSGRENLHRVEPVDYGTSNAFKY